LLSFWWGNCIHWQVNFISLQNWRTCGLGVFLRWCRRQERPCVMPSDHLTPITDILLLPLHLGPMSSSTFVVQFCVVIDPFLEDLMVSP
jgi:hypothetical protein